MGLSVYNISFLLLAIEFMLQKITKVVFVCKDCLAGQNMQVSQTCVCQRFYFRSPIRNPIQKIPLAFCRGNQGDANFRISLQKCIIPAAL